MKYIFLLALLIGTPALAGFLRSNQRYLVHTAFAVGLLMFVAAPSLWAAPIPWPGWPGPVQGLEVSFLDGISIALIVATRPVHISSSIKLAFAIICLAVVVSTCVSVQAEPAMFYAFQLFRAAMLFVAIARLCGTVAEAPIALMAGLGAGLIYEAGFAGYQYMTGFDRPGGNLGHSNFLGFASHFVVLPAFALLLGTRRTFWPGAVVLSGGFIALVGGSRATLATFGVGLVLTLILALQRRPTSRKWAFGGAAAVMLLISAPVMLWALDRRSEESKISSDAERTAMKLAARMIIADHPLGIGANQYVVVANTAGYSARAGVAWNYSSRSAPVHDTYYLVTAELGFLGLVGLISLLSAFVVQGFRLLRRRGDEPSAELVPGLLAAMLAACFNLNFEWVFMHFVLHYVFAISAGMLVGIGARMRMSARRPAPVPRHLAVAPQAG